jgi:hypothetical protein
LRFSAAFKLKSSEPAAKRHEIFVRGFMATIIICRSPSRGERAMARFRLTATSRFSIALVRFGGTQSELAATPQPRLEPRWLASFRGRPGDPPFGLSLPAKFEGQFLLAGACSAERRLELIQNTGNNREIDTWFSTSPLEPIANFEHLGVLSLDLGQLLETIRMVSNSRAQLGVGPAGRRHVAADSLDVLPNPVGGKEAARGDELPEEEDVIGGMVSISLGRVEVVRVAQSF